MRRVLKAITAWRATILEYTIEISRSSLDNIAEFQVIPDDINFKRVDSGGVPAEWVWSSNVNEDYVIIYLHGGGYTSGTIENSREFAARLSKLVNVRVLLPGYRLAPENPFPAALEDSVSAYEWLLLSGIKSKNICIVGVSSGGGLAITTLIKLRDRGIHLPSSAVLISPWTDLTNSGESIRINAKKDPMLYPEELEFYKNNYLGDHDPHDPLVSPLFADLKNLPPLFIQVGSYEILLDDSIRLAEKAKKAGVKVTLDIWDDMVHTFVTLDPNIPETIQAAVRIKKFIERYLFKSTSIEI
jgi:acetyl esterase/lipase